MKTIFKSRLEAEKVAKAMLEHTDKYGVVTLHDFYEICGHEASLNYSRYGWVNLKKIEVYLSLNDDGFLLTLPDPIILDLDIEMEPSEPKVEKVCPYLPYTESGTFITSTGTWTTTKFPPCIGDRCVAYKNGECKRLTNG